MESLNFLLIVFVTIISLSGLSLLLLLNINVFLHQLFFGFLPGIFLGFLFYKINLLSLKKYLPFILGFFIFLTFLTLLPPFGKKIFGASRWLNLGPFSFQPSEFLKLVFILYLSAWLEKKKSIFHFLILLSILALIFLLQPHFSSLIIVGTVSISLYLLATNSLVQFLKLLFFGTILVVTFAFISPYRFQRILTFLNPSQDPLGAGYQFLQSQIHIGSGRIFGEGFSFNPNQKFLPQSFSDAIFAVFAQKTGFVGSLILLLIYFLIFLIGMKIGSYQKNKFLSLLSKGISIWLLFQALFNIGGLCGILPLAGVHLPFMSAGGSAILSEILGIAIILNIGKRR